MSTVEVTVVRTVTSDQVARMERMLDAARDLAREGGYPAVTIHDVAARAGASRATVYRYFSSKDHLLAAVFARWVDVLAEQFRARPPKGRTPADRVAALFDRLVDAAVDESGLTSAAVHATVSADPSAWRSQPRLHHMMEDYLDAALGDAAVRGDRREIATVLAHVQFSALVSLTRGAPADDVRGVLRTAARVVLR